MSKTKSINTLETIGLSVLAFTLAQLAAHATDLSPEWGATLGVVCTAGVNLLNGWLAKTAPNGTLTTPAEKVVALAFKPPQSPQEGL